MSFHSGWARKNFSKVSGLGMSQPECTAWRWASASSTPFDTGDRRAIAASARVGRIIVKPTRQASRIAALLLEVRARAATQLASPNQKAR